MDENGVKVGQIATAEAIRMAEERTLDLVEVAPLAKPPVCRIMDYGKYRYQLQKKEKDARKKQKVQTLKEIKMRPKIDEHDFNFKVKAIRNFLEEGHRVKVSVFFRGREMAFLSRGEEVPRSRFDPNARRAYGRRHRPAPAGHPRPAGGEPGFCPAGSGC